jgi:hypothetical protein
MASLVEKKMGKREINRLCNNIRTLITKKEFQEVSSIINESSYEYLINLNNFGMNHLMVEYYLTIEDYTNFTKLFQSLVDSGKIKKRNILLYVNHLISLDKIEDAFAIFRELLVGKFPITSSNLEFICSYQVGHSLLEFYQKSLVKIQQPSSLPSYPVVNNCCSNCNQPLIKIDFDQNEKKQIANLLQKLIKPKVFKKYVNKLSGKTYQIVIDGANVLYYGQGKIDRKSYHKLIQLIDYLTENVTSEVLLVLHKRHFRNEMVKKYGDLISEIKLKCEILATPPGHNDDWYIILASLLKNAEIVTNDKFRDHEFQLKSSDQSELVLQKSLIANLVDDKTRNYSFINDDIFLESKKHYSNRIQNINDLWHVPCTDESFVCLKKMK